ncbi:MAG: guanylate kinase [bacterium]|nr:guanylate kinase [bacterium]
MAGLIVVISAPSGTGKTTICKHLLESFIQIKHSVSYTTRKPRLNEIEGESYHFVNMEKFNKMIKNNEFIEWAKVHGNYYGTSKRCLNEIIKENYDAILDLDVQGGINIRKKYKKAVLIFIIPPSMHELRSRLKGRNTEEVEHLEDRLKCAKEEVSYIFEYKYYLVNYNIKDTVNNLKAIIIAERHRISNLPSGLIKSLKKGME